MEAINQTDVPFDLLLDAAMNLREAGFPKLAIKVLKEANDINPDISLQNYLMGSILLETGQEAEAELFLREAAELDPFETNALNELTQLLMKQERGDEAVEFLGKLIEEYPENSSLLVIFLKTLIEVGKLEEVSEIISDIWAKSNDPRIGGLYGIVLASKKDYLAAEEVLNQVVKVIQDPQYQYFLALTLFGLDDYDRALTVLEEIQEPDRDVVDLLRDVGFQFYDAQRFDEARLAIEHILKIDSSFLDDWWMLSDIYLELDRDKDALKAAETALEIFNSKEEHDDFVYSELTELRVKALIELKELEQALGIVNDELAQDPRSGEFHALQVEILEKLGRTEEG